MFNTNNTYVKVPIEGKRQQANSRPMLDYDGYLVPAFTPFVRPTDDFGQPADSDNRRRQEQQLLLAEAANLYALMANEPYSPHQGFELR